MVSIVALWLPIVVSAVLVFAVSSVMHMVLPLHKADFKKLPAEDDVMDALRKFNIPPGDYMMPLPAGVEAMRSPEHKARVAKGPIGVMTFFPPNQIGMGAGLAQWFVYSIVVGVFAAYISGHALGPAAHYLQVFRFVGAVAFMCYGVALVQNSIWYKRNWGTSVRYLFDALVYGMFTAGTFGWLWPR